MIDTVDISDPRASTALDAALSATGFVKLTGHGLAPELVARLWAAMDELFALPLATKRRYVVADPLANRGYRERGSEALAYSLGEAAPPDLFESFNVAHPSRSSQHPLKAPVVWPEQAPSFETAAIGYLGEMERVSRQLDGLIGQVLGIPDLADRSLDGPDTMACIRYEHRADEDAAIPTQSRMGAHSDYTTFTILCADPVPGLEILTADGWVPVVPEPGTLLMNVGDLLAMWTNDRWPSTIHRVPLKRDGTDAPVRRSVAYFHYPDLDLVVEPPKRPASGEAKYPPVSVGEHLSSKLVGPKELKRSAGASTLDGRSL